MSSSRIGGTVYSTGYPTQKAGHFIRLLTSTGQPTDYYYYYYFIVCPSRLDGSYAAFGYKYRCPPLFDQGQVVLRTLPHPNLLSGSLIRFIYSKTLLTLLMVITAFAIPYLELSCLYCVNRLSAVCIYCHSDGSISMYLLGPSRPSSASVYQYSLVYPR